MSNKVKVSDREWRKQRRKNRFKNKSRDDKRRSVDKFSRKHRRINKDQVEDEDWYSS